MLLDGKTVLVTGAAQGIGKAIARALLAQGCSVAINDLNAGQAKATAEELAAGSSKVIAVAGDVALKDDVERMFQAAVKELGRLDILVNNAGIVLKCPFWEISETAWDKIMAVNLKGTFLCCQAAAGYMRQQMSGRIINIASVAGKRGGGLLGNTAYAASKAGVLGLTKGLARELGPFGVNVNAITPALTETEMTKDLTPEKRNSIVNSMALGRPGKPEDIANAVVFLASPLSDFITGEIMDVDGGFMMD